MAHRDLTRLGAAGAGSITKGFAITTKLMRERCEAAGGPEPACQSEGSTAEVAVALPADDCPAGAEGQSALLLVELLLKDPARADALGRDEARQPELIPRFLGIALAAYVLFSMAMVVILSTAPSAAYPRHALAVPPARWSDWSGLGLLAAYSIGLVATTCICLPSFYFFALLAGVRLSMLQVVGQIVRSKASSALVLVGILPIYVAVVLGMVVFEAPAPTLEFWLYVGLALPFVAGLEGVRSIYRGVRGMAETLPPERRCRRECFLRRLTLSWAACYTAVSPVMIYRLWEYLAGVSAA